MTDEPLALWRLRDVWDRAGLSGSADPVYDELATRYAEPHRAYHTLDHIEACLRELDTVMHRAGDPDALALALWFHDAVYDTHARDSEERSAALARELLGRASLSSPRIERIEQMVLATRHDATPLDADTCLLVDVDLSILGQDEPTFDRYETQVRFEYAWVPEDAFRAGRAAVVSGFLARPFIYATDEMRQRYEAAARANLTRSLTLWR